MSDSSRGRLLADSVAPQAAVTELVKQMRVITKDHPVDDAIVRIVDELRQPLQVAVVGKTKAGKSTLINSLVGAPVAPTDTLSCTRIVAWYRYDDEHDWAQARLRDRRYPVTIAWPPHADRPLAPGVTDDDIEDFHVWRHGLPQLDSWTVIDTPGYNESEPDVRERTRRVFGGETIDAVVFVLNGAAAEDELGFFTAVRLDLGAVFAASSGESYSSPSDFGLVNTIAVLTRIDNGDEHDPFDNAQKIIAQNEVAMRGVATTIIPVLGLLAETARSLTDDDYNDLLRLTTLQDYQFAAQLFGAAAARAGLTDVAIERIPRLLGAYGMPFAVRLLRTGGLSKDALAAALLAESRIGELEEALRERFTDRTDALKARTAVRRLDRLCRGHTGLTAFRPQLARILHLDRMHTLLEYEAYERWKSGVAKLRPRIGEALTTLALRQDAAVRTGLEPGATDDQLIEALWQRLAEVDDFLSEQWPQPSKDIARIMRRSYSLMLADLKPGGGQ